MASFFFTSYFTNIPAILWNAYSTCYAVLALVYMYWISGWISVTLFISSSKTALFYSKSHLFPFINESGTDKKQLSVPWTGVLYFIVPIINSVIEWSLVSDVKNDHQSMCSSIVRAGYCSETFMTCSVPNLQLDFAIIERKWFKPEINSNSCQKYFAKLIICISDNNRWLPDTRITWFS